MDAKNQMEMKRKIKYVYCFLALLSLFIIWKLNSLDLDLGTLQDTVLNKEVSCHCDQYTHNPQNSNKLTTIFVITPTYWRHVQKAELTRISQVLQLASVSNSIHWVVVEDSEEKTVLVTNFLRNLPLKFTHLNAKTPPFEKLKGKDPRWKKHRGVEQRNAALKWLRENNKATEKKAVVYFMDDDNAYDTRVFSEMSKVKKVGVWPVGLVGGLNAESPILDSETGKVKAYRSGWKANRPFAIDMAGFAINLDLILTKPNANFSYKMEKGYQESEFLSYFTTKSELEPLADNCTKVYVWHTRTEKPLVNGIIKGLEV